MKFCSTKTISSTKSNFVKKKYFWNAYICLYIFTEINCMFPTHPANILCFTYNLFNSVLGNSYSHRCRTLHICVCVSIFDKNGFWHCICILMYIDWNVSDWETHTLTHTDRQTAKQTNKPSTHCQRITKVWDNNGEFSTSTLAKKL